MRLLRSMEIETEQAMAQAIGSVGAWLFADGGVIHRNPSPYGGTYAWRHMQDGMVIAEDSGVVLPADLRTPTVTNNITELIALIAGMEALPVGWNGICVSDSQITIGRLFWGWQWRHVPQVLITRWQVARSCLGESVTSLHVDGHPTQAQLAAGRGKRGNPVSEHNVWCDQACTAAGLAYLATFGDAG